MSAHHWCRNCGAKVGCDSALPARVKPDDGDAQFAPVTGSPGKSQRLLRLLWAASRTGGVCRDDACDIVATRAGRRDPTTMRTLRRYIDDLHALGLDVEETTVPSVGARPRIARIAVLNVEFRITEPTT